ncbi:uncharacterized protein BO95DRAFT_448464 [Aspergillus brunneoviolaceus CBS 621.78]|uniref:Uncharacterized protein n=1 Tax=Aspergillus brunneoviolaceus CBS 621.78 TaxID=1450534 RepID=A0ACD1FS21_9EURO|nr:hypothetical protein BO95DRAFT_448464 [Aspergillus brunneoviolaceus CBS 621.78]RAH39771.1 hypothetical protein BO95DRAFT_448464 [Aspergillus brunneoviolaceus CBS 621.78]
MLLGVSMRPYVRLNLNITPGTSERVGADNQGILRDDCTHRQKSTLVFGTVRIWHKW